MIYLKNISETFQDFPDNKSLAVIVFFYGCTHNCYNCQNKELQNYPKTSKGITVEEAKTKITDYCKRSNTKAIVFSGGDPYYPVNPENLRDMLTLISSLELGGYRICVYTGYDINYVNSLYKALRDMNSHNISMPSFCKKPSFVKCGKYEDNNRDENMGKKEAEFILASKNQRFYYREDDEFLPMSSTHIIRI